MTFSRVEYFTREEKGVSACGEDALFYLKNNEKTYMTFLQYYVQSNN